MISKIFAFFINLGISECTRSLSKINPLINCVSDNDSPCFLIITILSMSTVPSSSTDNAASTIKSAICELSPEIIFDDIEVLAIFNNESLSFNETSILIEFNNSKALSIDRRYPSTIILGCISISNKS